MTTVYEGGCQCGAVRYRASGAPLLACICHCTMCRRAHAAPSVAWAAFEQSQVSFSGTPKVYPSSAEAQRSFCAECGTPIGFTAAYMPGLVDIAIGSLDAPEALPPQLHCWYSRHLAWAEYADDLPRHGEFPPHG